MTRVLVTGAAGTIGTALRRLLPELGWEVAGLDRSPAPGVQAGDITDPAALDEALTGADAIVHLAGQPTEAPWPVIRAANVEGTYQVFEGARRAGVRRVVFASSNHAVGFTPLVGTLPGDVPPRPDTLYGVSKAFGEALARYYVDRYGFAVACLRIGTFGDRPANRRALATWLSPGDCARLVDACLRAPDLTFALLWGISANARRTWSLDEALALGYRPQDDAERFVDTVAENPGGDGADDDGAGRVGGPFTGASYGIDEIAEQRR